MLFKIVLFEGVFVIRRQQNIVHDINILIVDDDDEFLKNIKEFLKLKGFICETTNNPEEVPDIIKNKDNVNYDVVITDYFLKEFTGLNVTKNIRKINKNIYIILLTGYSEIMDFEEAMLNYDIDSYSVKTSNLDNILEKLYVALKAIKKKDEVINSYNISNLPKNLKFLRAKYDITQQQLSEELNLKRSTIACYESEKIKPSMSQLQNIANYFHLHIGQLLSEELENLIS
jgi:DNA-binding NtrC family response regulator